MGVANVMPTKGKAGHPRPSRSRSGTGAHPEQPHRRAGHRAPGPRADHPAGPARPRVDRVGRLDRLGGQLIASHIRIQNGGPVPDYVHHHDVSFQMIYCYKGWVQVVYEDQGPPFVMRAGDCVLQPPHIRHRVLECSDNMEVIEVSSPAEHETFVDHDLSLPNENIDPTRDFGGQRFVFHESGKASWQRATCEGFEARDTGIEQATNGLVAVQALRPLAGTTTMRERRNDSMSFNYVLQGSLVGEHENVSPQTLMPGDALVVPAGSKLVFSNIQKDTELLQLVPGVSA